MMCKELSQNNWYSLFDSAFDIDVVYNTWVCHFCKVFEKSIPLLGQGMNLGWMVKLVVRYAMVIVCLVLVIIDQINFHEKSIIDNRI